MGKASAPKEKEDLQGKGVKMRKGFRGKGEDGTVMIEWSIGMLLCILILVFFIGFSMYLYQNVMFHVTANEAAQRVAENYKYDKSKSDLFLVSEKNITDIGVYRYWSFKNDARVKAADNRAMEFLNNRLTKVNLGKDRGGTYCKVERYLDDIGRHHIEIKMYKNYGFLFGGILKAVGIKDTETLQATVAVSDYDALQYIHYVKFTKYAVDKAKDTNGITKAADSLVSIINRFFGGGN